MGGNLRFKVETGVFVVGRKFTIFALFYFVFEGKFQVQPPPGRVFCVTILGGLYLEGLTHGGAYFQNFTVDFPQTCNQHALTRMKSAIWFY